MKETYACIAIICAILAIFTDQVAAVPGDLDQGFGNNGMVTTDFPGFSSQGWSMALQNDGRIVAGGIIFNENGFGLAVVRYMPNGGLDMEFNGTGKFTFIPIGSGLIPTLVILQQDGKILFSQGGGNIFRITSSGAIDLTFNSTGSVATGFFNYALAIQADGKVLVAGRTLVSPPDFVTARFNADGSSDTSFNATGKVITDLRSSDEVRSIAIQGDGKIVVAGQTGTGAAIYPALARYNIDGTLDMSFGFGGKVVVEAVVAPNAKSIMFQNDGKIVVAARLYMFRFLSNGNLDASFGGGAGYIAHPFNAVGSVSIDAKIQSDEKILLAGWTPGTVSGFSVIRYNRDGSLDTTFANTGTASVVTGATLGSAGTGGTDLAIQSDGRILVAGTANLGSAASPIYNFAVVRWQGVPSEAEIDVEQPAGTNLVSSTAQVAFGTLLTGTASNRSFTIKNHGGANLTVVSITFDGPDAGDFTVTASPAATVPGPNGSTPFTVRFAPAAAGSKSAILHIASNDADEASFDIALTGRALAPSADDDGDGVSNEAEMNLAALGFDPLVANGATVSLLRDNGLSAGTDLQTVALHRPVLEKDGATGHFHLSIGVETSPDLDTWTPLLNFTPTYNPTTGRIELEFTPTPATTQFFRVLGAKP